MSTKKDLILEMIADGVDEDLIAEKAGCTENYVTVVLSQYNQLKRDRVYGPKEARIKKAFEDLQNYELVVKKFKRKYGYTYSEVYYYVNKD